MREFEHNGEWYEVDDYLPEHHFQNQTSWAAPGVALNPTLRADFDNTPNEERDSREIDDWWLVPYIVTYGWNEPPETINEATREEWRDNWFKRWPSGTRFDLRCLDGGAWDRSTFRGAFPTLEEAVGAAQALAGQINAALAKLQGSTH